MKRARFIAQSRREFLAGIAYYNEQEVGLGGRFARAVEAATARAIAFPLAGSRASKNTLRVFVKGFPYSVVYQADEGGIVIFALSHHARLPGYWESRVQEG